MDYSILYGPLSIMLSSCCKELRLQAKVPEVEINWEFRPQFFNRKNKGDFSSFSIVKNVNRLNKRGKGGYSPKKYAEEVVAIASARIKHYATCSVLEEPLAAIERLSCSNGYIHFYLSQ